MANRPRWIKEDSVYSEVQRTVDRSFLFKPDEQIRQIIGSSAGRALAKFPVIIYWLEFNINHKQQGIAPISGAPEHIQNYSEFQKMFNSLVAKGINKYLGREGAVYSTRNRSTEVLGEQSLEQQLFYAVTNVVEDGLVDRVADLRNPLKQTTSSSAATRTAVRMLCKPSGLTNSEHLSNRQPDRAYLKGIADRATRWRGSLGDNVIALRGYLRVQS